MNRPIYIERKQWMMLAAICITMAVVCMSFFIAPDRIYAYTSVGGTVVDGPVFVRESPPDGSPLVKINPGTRVTVVDEVQAADGCVWYRVDVTVDGAAYAGYTRSDFIRLDTVAAEGNGVIDNTDIGVNVRSGAGTSYSVVVKVFKGQSVEVLSQTQGEGMVWYNVSFSLRGVPYTGWVCADYVTVNGEALGSGGGGAVTDVPDEAYVAALQEAGFPESYCNSLLALHQKYPNWQFVPVQTGLDWNTVIANESLVGRNLIQNSANDARKSVESGAYDWATNTWYGYDGPGWVSANSAYIAYCMDPRNFLNETYIYQFETLGYAPYQNADGVSSILANTFMNGNYTDTDGAAYSYADTFVQVGSSLAVSPYHLASRCKQEQGTRGTSPLISGAYSGYDGYYNYFNVGAYVTSTASATVNGLTYAKRQGWDSIYKSIAGGSQVVADNYVKKGQDTIYFEKFNVVNIGNLYEHQYMTNVQAAMSEGSNMGKAYTDKSQAFVFRIPVYTNMPASAVTFADSGNPNNWLSSLTVNADGYALTPGFHGATTEYSLVVGADVSTIRVDAAAVAGSSTVSGTGNYSLDYGNNTISVTCISQSGQARTYTITVARQQTAAGGGAIDLGGGAWFTMPYVAGTYLTGIQPESTADEMLAQLSGEGCTAKVLNADGTENTGIVGTGNRLTVYVGEAVAKQYEVVVYGDINGDGKISNADLVLMQKQILDIQKQDGSYLAAADISRDGKVSNADLVLLQKHILDIAKINQQ